MLFTSGRTWDEAEQICSDTGGHLISLHSWETVELVQNFIFNENVATSVFYIGMRNASTVHINK